MPAYLCPTTLDEAFASLHQGKEVRYLAGGTDVIVLMRDKVISPEVLLDVKALPELQGIHIQDGKLRIGAAVTCNEIIDSELIGDGCALLKEASAELANTLLRNRATLVGNLCNASPGADLAPAALVLKGEVQAVTPSGSRDIPLKNFFVHVKKNALEPGELVTAVSFPLTKGKGYYLKKKRIRGHDLAQVGVAGFHDEDGTFRLALGAVAITPLLLDDFGKMSAQELGERKDDIVAEALSAAKPISDIRSSLEYRKAMVGLFTARIVDALAHGTEVVR